MWYSSKSVLISISLKINWDSKANQTKKSSIPWTCFLLWISQVILKHVFHLQIDTQVKSYEVFLTLSRELWCCSVAVIAVVHRSMRCPLLLVITSVWMAVVMYSTRGGGYTQRYLRGQLTRLVIWGFAAVEHAICAKLPLLLCFSFQ